MRIPLFVAVWISIVVSPTLFADTFTVIINNDIGPGSFRQAITDANNHAGSDTIAFNIPGAGVHTINVLSDLPQISGPTTIDGTTQPGFAGTPLIEITGGGTLSTGLSVAAAASSSVIRGLVINGFASTQILSFGSPALMILGNYIGLNAAGTAIVANSGAGITTCCGGSVIIGGGTVAARNVISTTGSSQALNIGGGPASIQGNYIGLNAAGTARVGNVGTGILISNTSATIGGPLPGDRNVIVGSTGVAFSGNPASGHSTGEVRGNFIGTDVTGTVALNLGGDGTGVLVAHGTGVNIIGNLISGNGDGI